MSLAGVALGTLVAIGSAPIFVGAIEAVIERRLPSIRWGVATVITVTGGVLLVWGRQAGLDAEGDGASVVTGITLALFAGLAYGVFTYLASRLIRPSGRRPEGLAERPAIAAMQLVTAVPLLVVAVFADLPSFDQWNAWGILLYIAIGPSAIGYVLYAFGLARVSASSAALFTLFEPVVAALLATLLLHERLGVPGWAGIASVVVGLAVLTAGSERHGGHPPAGLRGSGEVTEGRLE